MIHLMNSLRSEIAQIEQMEKKYDALCDIIHTEYYRLFPHDNRSLDRTNDEYPMNLLNGIINKEMWQYKW